MNTLITGHTGFKGAWLLAMLRDRDVSVSGVALPPEIDSLFTSADLVSDLNAQALIDIRDEVGLRDFVAQVSPEVVIHLAAQPLVRESYLHPHETVTTNVVGTMNVMEASRNTPSVGAQVIITTDKVYRNVGKREGYVESDPLGGHDPYSSSKAMADLLAQSWVDSFAGPTTGIARAGNVIGGGDFSKDRLLPDLMRSFARGEVARIRFPQAVRPWQHVLDCLNGYLLLTERLVRGEGGGAWNFGPPPENAATVAEVATMAAELWGGGARWEPESGDHPHEAELLTLNSQKARSELNWSDRLSLEESVGWVVEWHQRVLAGENPRTVTFHQVHTFNELG